MSKVTAEQRLEDYKAESLQQEIIKKMARRVWSSPDMVEQDDEFNNG